MTIRVVLVDDQALVRAGLAMMLAAQPDMAVAGEAGDGAEAIDLVARTPSDVVVMDLRMPVLDGVAATRAITARPDAPRVLALTTFDTDEDAFAALQAGASGFLLKNSPPAELLTAIRAIAAGDAVVAPRTTRQLLNRFADRLGPPGTDLGKLTQRELDVLRLVGAGRSNLEIATELAIADATVKSHFNKVLAKLGLRDRVHAVIYAYENGLR